MWAAKLKSDNNNNNKFSINLILIQSPHKLITFTQHQFSLNMCSVTYYHISKRCLQISRFNFYGKISDLSVRCCQLLIQFVNVIAVYVTTATDDLASFGEVSLTFQKWSEQPPKTLLGHIGEMMTVAWTREERSSLPLWMRMKKKPN